MIKRCFPVLLALVMVGCSSSAPGSVSNVNGTAVESIAENNAPVNVTFGDYTAEVPQSWIPGDDCYYLVESGYYPYVRFVYLEDVNIKDIFDDWDSFIDGVLTTYDNGQLVSDLSSVNYDKSIGYAFTISCQIEGVDVDITNTIFNNPSGGIAVAFLYSEDYDSLPEYMGMLDTVYTGVPFSADSYVISEPVADSPTENDTPEESNDSTISTGERNALSKAKDYLLYTAFSYSGLIEQLEYEGFTHEEAVYGADHCGADWKEQAAKKAADYLEYSSFSRDGLIEQLEYVGFTHEEAEYGVAQSYD